MPEACLGPWTQAFYCIAWSLPGMMCCLEPAWDHGPRYSAALTGACLGPYVARSLPGTTATGCCIPGACLGPQPLARCMPGAYLGPWPHASCCKECNAWNLHRAAMPGACLEPWTQAFCCIAWSPPGTMCCLEPACVHSRSCTVCMPYRSTFHVVRMP